MTVMKSDTITSPRRPDKSDSLKSMEINDEKQFGRLCSFLRRNHNWPKRYHAHSVSRACYGMRSAKDKLTAIFRSALESNSGGGLSLNARALKTFRKKLTRLGRKKHITIAEFLSCFASGSANELFDTLIKIDGVGKKKAALFLRDLWITSSLHRGTRVFDRRFPHRQHLRIPFDRVIAVVLNQVVKGTPFRDGINLGHSFDTVNQFAEIHLHADRMLLEDLWFWGFFGLSGTGFDRRPEVNHEKLLMNPYFGCSERPLAKFREFGRLVFPRT